MFLQSSTSHIRAFLVACVGAGCSAAVEVPPAIDQSNACPVSINLTLLDPQLGTVAWTPFCGAAGLMVQRQRDPFLWDAVWFLQPHTKLIFPSVTYGVVPVGAMATLNPAAPALESGRSYRVIVIVPHNVTPMPSITWTVP